ncbi:MAG: DUF6569 family protein [Thermoanaerobaculia bacterium]|nr:DUF6569 family protein [Thermoanaerobaculia bacterium]
MGDESMEMGSTLEAAKAWLGAIETGKAVHYENLTLVPLVRAETGSASAGDERRYVLLDDALAAEEAAVEEVSEGGSVPLLAVDNQAVEPILIPEGQILIGAKQNRTVNLTVLVAGKTKFELPVSCVEQGRWSYRERRFRAGAFSHPRLRHRKVKSAQQARAAGGRAMSDQGVVWESVEEQLSAVAAESPTRDAVDAYEATRPRLETYREQLALPDGASGVLAVVGGEVVGFDLFDEPETLAKLWPRLADAYFFQAVADRGRADEVASRSESLGVERDLAKARRFLATVRPRLAPAATQPDLGFEMELEGDDLAGAGVWHQGAICHLAAFAVEEGVTGIAG